MGAGRRFRASDSQNKDVCLEASARETEESHSDDRGSESAGEASPKRAQRGALWARERLELG